MKQNESVWNSPGIYGMIKQVTDVLITLAMLFLMGYQFWGEQAHEWVGAGIFLLFILHHVLNRQWYKTLSHGKYTPFRIFQTLVNILVLVSMLALMYSSIVMSRYVFSFLPISGKTASRNLLPAVFSPWPCGFLLWAGGIDQEELPYLFAVKE